MLSTYSSSRVLWRWGESTELFHYVIVLPPFPTTHIHCLSCVMPCVPSLSQGFAMFMHKIDVYIRMIVPPIGLCYVVAYGFKGEGGSLMV